MRELRTLVPLEYHLLTERRTQAPRGAGGGGNGAVGRNFLDGEPLPAKSGGPLKAGQTLRVETPGGGGYG